MDEVAGHHEVASVVRGATTWVNRPGTTPTTGADALVLPDGCMDLMWIDGELLVCGADTAARRVGASTTTRLGIRLAPGHLPAALGHPAHALLDQRVRLEEVLEGRARDLAVRATEDLQGPDGSTAVLERLAADLGVGRSPTGFEDAVACRADAGWTVTAIADDLGVGTRQLHRRCVEAFGYGPKVLARILRLQRALALGRAGIDPARVAIDAGYADQPHLARDVRALTGTTWSTLLRPTGRDDPQPRGA